MDRTSPDANLSVTRPFRDGSARQWMLACMLKRQRLGSATWEVIRE
jgi:hypothetical protein